jgi:sterol desaturase/sphingolipid hydroxylase (fatty acid hydroxylase superfamily)
MSMLFALVIVAGTLLALPILERLEGFRFEPSPVLRPLFLTDVVYFLTGFVVLPLLETCLLDASAVRERLSVLSADNALPGWTIVVLAYVVIDLANYLAHVLLHQVDPLWEFHKVHHSSLTLDWIAGFRAHIVEQLLRQTIVSVLVVLAFPLEAIALAGAFQTSWTAFVHSNSRIDLRILEPVFVTPRLHRLHHVPETARRNLGGTLIVWDRLLGTFAGEPVIPGTQIGVPEEILTYPQGWLRQLLEPAMRLAGRTQLYGAPSS